MCCTLQFARELPFPAGNVPPEDRASQAIAPQSKGQLAALCQTCKLPDLVARLIIFFVFVLLNFQVSLRMGTQY